MNIYWLINNFSHMGKL